jgi:hypothetical protein
MRWQVLPSAAGMMIAVAACAGPAAPAIAPGHGAAAPAVGLAELRASHTELIDAGDPRAAELRAIFSRAPGSHPRRSLGTQSEGNDPVLERACAVLSEEVRRPRDPLRADRERGARRADRPGVPSQEERAK